MKLNKPLIVCLLPVLIACEVSVQKAPSLRNTKVETYYLGNLPCPDCESLETIIELKSDQTYILSERYLGKENNIQFEYKGPFNWLEDGTIIHLLNFEGPSYYKVDTAKLTQLEDNLHYKIGPERNSYFLPKNKYGSAQF
jgi:uncharacterized lipoprotein NlpE involved in copper resistance